MRKIIAAFDGLKCSLSTQDYAIGMAHENQAHLVGIFLEDLVYHSYKIYDLITEEGGGLDTKRRHLDKKDLKTRAEAVVKFETACRRERVSRWFRASMADILMKKFSFPLFIAHNK